jgi:hypothetical protein
MMTILDCFDNEISIILSCALYLWWVYRQFYMDGFEPWVWDGVDRYIASCLEFFLFCSFSREIAFLILTYPWVSVTELVCAWISL